MSYQFPIRLIAGSLAVLVVCASYGAEQRYSPQELEAAKGEVEGTQSAVDVPGRSHIRPRMDEPRA